MEKSGSRFLAFVAGRAELAEVGQEGQPSTAGDAISVGDTGRLVPYPAAGEVAFLVWETCQLLLDLPLARLGCKDGVVDGRGVVEEEVRGFGWRRSGGRVEPTVSVSVATVRYGYEESAQVLWNL
jgi:hypothetical protein